MVKDCIHCNKPNPDGWFNCRSCGKRSSEPMYTTQLILRDASWATAIRKDKVDFNTISMDDSIKSMENNMKKENAKKWDARVKKAWRQGD